MTVEVGKNGEPHEDWEAAVKAGNTIQGQGHVVRKSEETLVPKEVLPLEGNHQRI